jgi:hypothetical protein
MRPKRTTQSYEQVVASGYAERIRCFSRTKSRRRIFAEELGKFLRKESSSVKRLVGSLEL